MSVIILMDQQPEQTANAERELALRFVEGRDEAVEEVYERYQQAIQRFVWMITRDHQLSEDVVQEVFIRAFQKRDLLKEPYNISSWLFTIARNITMRQLKKARPAREELIDQNDELDALAADASPQPGKSSMQRQIHFDQIKNVMSEAMDRLDPAAAQMIYLHYFEHKTFQQIADELEVPLGTVCTKISRSLKAMHKTMKRSGYHTRDLFWTRRGTAGY